MSVLKKRKVDSECRVFNEQWTINYFFVQSKHTCLCLICGEYVSMFKEYNLKRHYVSKHSEKFDKFEEELRKKMLQEFKDSLEKRQNSFKRVANENMASVRASYRVASIIAKEGKPFTDGEFVKKCILETVEEITPNAVKSFSCVSLSASTVTRRIEDLGSDISLQLKERARNFTHFSLALDESEDISHTSQLIIFVRGINQNFEVCEELATLKSLKDATTGENIFLSLTETLDELELNWEKLTCVTTDGAKSMVGCNIGLIGRLNRLFDIKNICQPMYLHCIIHQQSLCGSVLNLKSVMSTVISIVNYIRKSGLNHRQFKSFVEDIESEYGDLLFHSEVRWLSRGKVLKRFYELRYEIEIFMTDKSKPIPELSDPAWLWDLAFLTDLTEHLNYLNLNLQGNGKLVHELFFDIKAFQRKLDLFRQQFQQNIFPHFPCCDSLRKQISTTFTFPVQKCIANITLLQNELNRRFQDFYNNEKSFVLFHNPFEIVVDDIAINMQLELIDLQSNDELKSLFKIGNLINFYYLLPESKYKNIKNFARKMISIFGSTYICEQSFSRMQHIKSKTRSRLSDNHLEDFLKMGITNLTPNIDTIMKTKKQTHSSH